MHARVGFDCNGQALGQTMSDSSLLIALDASTTSLRAIVFDIRGQIRAAGRSSLVVERIGRDGYEQNADSWWTAAKDAIRAALAELPEERRGHIVALTIAHQRETVVVTDAAGSPLAPALLWMDSRCHEDVATAERNVGTVRLHALTGKRPCTTPSLYKLMYLLRSRPDLRDVAHVHDVHSFLSLRFTGRAVSSFASADPLGLVDIRKKTWASPLTQLIGVEPHQLPELVELGYMIGPLTDQAIEETGLPADVLVYAGAGDGQAAGLGAGVVERNRGFVDLGTAVTCGFLVGAYQIDQAFRTLHAAIPGKYCLETTLRGGMLTLWWLIESVFAGNDRAAMRHELEQQAAHLSPVSDGLIALPYWAGVMNPYWHDSARGAYIGLHPGHRPAHLYRALLEGIALELRTHLEGVEAATGENVEDLVVLGGGSQSNLWCQIISDVLGRPVRRCKTPDAAALGAAVLAAVSHGIFPSFEIATSEMTTLGAEFRPGPARLLYDRAYREVYRGLYSELSGRMAALADLRELTNPSIPPSAIPATNDERPEGYAAAAEDLSRLSEVNPLPSVSFPPPHDPEKA